MRFTGKSAVITGAAQGIGAAVANKLAQEGAKVALLDINQTAVQTASDQIDGETIALECDVSNREQVDTAMAATAERFGSLDILVSNAGVTRDNLIHKMTDEDWDLVIDTHLKGSFYCCRAAQAYMVKQGYGKIVLMSSRATLGNRGQVNYAAAKAGMQGMARVLAIELGPRGINVNAVAPGHIETAMTRATAKRMRMSYDDLKARGAEANSIKRVGIPADVANTVAFLVSDESSYMTGQVLWVAGRPTV